MDWIQGQTIWPYADFTDIDGNPVDPSVLVIVRNPDGSTDTPTALNVSLGRWNFELLLEDVGIYRWEFHGMTVEGTAVWADQACVTASLMSVS